MPKIVNNYKILRIVPYLKVKKVVLYETLSSVNNPVSINYSAFFFFKLPNASLLKFN